jgi:hypothetical protein
MYREPAFRMEPAGDCGGTFGVSARCHGTERKVTPRAYSRKGPRNHFPNSYVFVFDCFREFITRGYAEYASIFEDHETIEVDAKLHQLPACR